MRAFILMIPLLLFDACQEDESISGYVSSESTWVLSELDGAPFSASATISFPEPGRVEGQAPCNRYFGNQQAPYPWIALSEIGATKMACSDLPAEAEFLKALEEMTLVEVSGETLIMSNDAGREMVFRLAQP